MLEFELGNQIIERLQGTSQLVVALETFLQNSRFGIIIVNENGEVVSTNNNAQDLADQIVQTNSKQLIPSLATLLRNNKETTNSAVNISDACKSFTEKKVYLHTTLSKKFDSSANEKIYKLIVVPNDNSKITIDSAIQEQYGLTKKESETLALLVQGATNKEISEAKFVSLNTVKSHIKSIHQKTGKRSQAELMNLILGDEIEKLNSFLNVQYPVDRFKLSQSAAHRIKTCKNKTLYYCDYGDPNDRPMVILHNNYASRLNVPYDYELHCKQHKRRIIVPDRPGYGHTPADPDYPHNWNHYLESLIKELEIEDFDLLANCLAAPLAFDFYRDKETTTKPSKIILTSPIFLSNSNHFQTIDTVLMACARLISHSPSIAREAFQLWLRSMSIDINTNPIHDLETSLGVNERDFLDNKEFKQTIIHNFQQCTRQNGIGSAADLINCLTLKDNILNEIDIPVDLWIGDCDELVSVEGVQQMFSALPNANINIREGYSKHIYYTLFGDIIAQ